MSEPRDSATEQAKRDLARVQAQGETIGGTAMNEAARGLAKADDEDSIERLGKKIGRGLAFIVLPFAVWYFGATAGWW